MKQLKTPFVLGDYINVHELTIHRKQCCVQLGCKDTAVQNKHFWGLHFVKHHADKSVYLSKGRHVKAHFKAAICPAQHLYQIALHVGGGPTGG